MRCLVAVLLLLGSALAAYFILRDREIKTLNLILAIDALLLVAFVVTMIWVYLKTGQEMQALTYTVIPVLFGEAGVSGWIKTTKIRHEDRSWQIEDREEERRYAAGTADFRNSGGNPDLRADSVDSE